MTQKELAQRLAATGLPVAYRAFRTRQAPPFICYLYVYDSQFFADNEMYYSTGHYQVELYSVFVPGWCEGGPGGLSLYPG